MKRIKSACIFQTLVFSQKSELGYSKERSLKINREEIDRYKAGLERSRTRYKIVSEDVQNDGSIIMHIRKQYNAMSDVSEYFN